MFVLKFTPNHKIKYH